MLESTLSNSFLFFQTYTFRSLSEGIDNLKVNAQSLPSVYPSGTSSNAHADVHKVVLESVMESTRGGVVREVLLMTAIKKEKFTLDVGHTHVVEAIGCVHLCSVANVDLVALSLTHLLMFFTLQKAPGFSSTPTGNND
jgi:hypothetical protein